MSKRPSPPIGSRWSRPLGNDADSTAAVAAERQGKNARQLLEAVALETGDEGIALSVVTVLELAHGIAPPMPPSAASAASVFLTIC